MVRAGGRSDHDATQCLVRSLARWSCRRPFGGLALQWLAVQPLAVERLR